MSPNVLAQSLRELDGARIVRRRKLQLPAASSVYERSEWGEELEPVVISLGRPLPVQAPVTRPSSNASEAAIPDAFASSISSLE